jgi:ABC-type xylose transport system substrate-binding protein
MPYDAPPWQKAFHATGVQVSDDDRVTLGGSGSPYVSFDRVEVGTQQGRTLVDCVKQSNVTNPP